MFIPQQRIILSFLKSSKDGLGRMIYVDLGWDKQRILEFLCAKGCASIGEIVETLDKFLPRSRPAKANRRRIVNLLSVTMGKKEGLVYNAMPRQSKWVLTDKGQQICRAGNSSCKRVCHRSVKG